MSGPVPGTAASTPGGNRMDRGHCGRHLAKLPVAGYRVFLVPLPVQFLRAGEPAACGIPRWRGSPVYDY